MRQVHTDIIEAIKHRKNFTVWKYENGNKEARYRVVCDHAGIRVYHFHTLMFEKLGFEKLYWFVQTSTSKALSNVLLTGTPFRLYQKDFELYIYNSKSEKSAKVETCEVTPYNLEALEELTK